MAPQRRLVLAAIAFFGAWPVTVGAAVPVRVYAAGSLRSLVTALAQDAARNDVVIVPTFGGSGTLRDRIERGETPDLFLSADLASPQALARKGRAQQQPVAFARNRLCLVARRSLALANADPVPRLIAKEIRIKTSKPLADPSGDYAMAMFALMDRVHRGAGQILHDKAAALWDATPQAISPGESLTAALFTEQRIDVAVTYCSAAGELAKASAGLETVTVPERYDPRPVFGLVLLSSSPAAAHLAQWLLSTPGQAAVSSAGMMPLPNEASK